MSNVHFLNSYDKAFDEIFSKAEEYVYSDPNTSLIKTRQFAELLAQFTAVKVGIPKWEASDFFTLLRTFKIRGVYGDTALDVFHKIRLTGNEAVHAGSGNAETAEELLKMAFQLAVVFHRGFGRENEFKATFKLSQANKTEILEASKKELERRNLEAEKELIALKEKLKIVEANIGVQSEKQKDKVASAVLAASSDLNLDEKATRLIIDQKLREAGWEADSSNIRFSKGARPKKNKQIAIAEWPTESGPADYALFHGLTLLGVVEAKKKSTDVKGKLTQSERYSKGIEIPEDVKTHGPWGIYKVPFLFSTNGRPYLEQLKEKSGIWFRDARRTTNLPRALVGWYSPDELLALAERDESKAIENLKSEAPEYLPLRDYQLKVVSKVEKAVIEGKREILVAMATGTGKTRTCIGLAYRLIKAKRFNRILFLVDRTSLGTQASDSFKELQIEDNKTFSQIYDIKELEDITPDTATKVHFSTVQALIKRVLYPSADQEKISVGQYDCIIVDECHRGYTLDKELSDEEFEYRNEDDYISKYRRVIEYFDAVKIGLTATPALHTTEIFGKPVASYSYTEAIVDGWLVDHLDPFNIKTKLGHEGIKWKKGEKVKVYDPETSKIEELASIPDELNLEVDDFNTKVITENFNRTVCKQLVDEIEWDTEEKTLIFCARDDHADLVVRLLSEEFEKKYGEVDAEAIQKITGASDKPEQLIKRFKNERFPSIAVTVDLLSTGIDVPKICNLVFIRKVKSRILFDQMLGRATRLCPEIGKEYFKIYDAVKLYDTLSPLSAMKPVSSNPEITLENLSNEWKKAKAESVKTHIINQIVAKINVRKRRITGEALEQFKVLTGGQDPEELVKTLKTKDLTKDDWEKRFEKVAAWLDRLKEEKKKMLISEHDDEALGISQDDFQGKKPEDYIKGFAKYVKENPDKVTALTIIAKRPKDLTRAELRELKIVLDTKGFKEQSLQSAYKKLTNKDIAASILGFIRREAIGDALIPFSQRLDQAITRIKSVHNLNSVQLRWIDRFRDQLEKEQVVDVESLDKGAFKIAGGFKKANKDFNGEVETILKEINEYIWQQAG